MSTREDPLINLCSSPFTGVGKVVEVSERGDLFSVKTGKELLSVRRAASCFVVPQAGDQVWLGGDLMSGVFVTAVLELSPNPVRHIRLPAGAVISTSQGNLTIDAENLHINSVKVSLQAGSAAVCVKKVVGVGAEVTWSFGQIKVVTDLFESFADKFVQFSRWSQRNVDGMDQVRSRQIDYRADQTVQIHGENLIANASNLVKIDGEQIHLG